MSASPLHIGDRDEIIRAARLLVVRGGITELRALDATLVGERRAGTVSGYFDCAVKLADALVQVKNAKGVYIVANEVDPSLLARAANRIHIVGKSDQLTADHNIDRRRWLFIDADAVRAAGISATDTEHEAALACVREIRDYLRSLGWPDPILGDSGNGGHGLFRIDLPRADDGLVQRCLSALAVRFTKASVKLDTSVHNPARIWKLYGTMACKGDPTPDRPHRMARLLDVPRELLVVRDEMLRALAGPVAQARAAMTSRGHRHGGFDLGDWIGRNLPDAVGPKPWQVSGRMWELPVCPFNADHAGGCAFVGCLPSGAITAGCHHESCQHWGWTELREQFEPMDRMRGLIATAGKAAPMKSDTGTPDVPPVPTFAPIPATELMHHYPALRSVVIDGLLRQGEVMNAVAAPKVGKSWLVHALAVSVASGRAWLGKSTTRGPVLLIDGELHRETLARRLKMTQMTLGVSDADMANLHVWPVRGQGITIDKVADALEERPPGEFRMIVVDALYRFMPPDGEENSNETMTQVYNTLDRIGEHTGACIVIVHHATKGSQAEKAVTDVGAGAGAQSRAADTHLILRPHEEADAVVVDAVVRSFPPIDPFVIRSMKPGWALAPGLDPSLLKKPAKKQRRTDADSLPAKPIRVWTPAEFATEIVRRDRSIRDDVIARGVAKGLGKGQSDSLLKRAIDAGVVHRHRDSPSAPHRFSIDPPATLADSGQGGMVGGLSAPGADAPGGVGGTRATPLPPSGTHLAQWGAASNGTTPEAP